MGEHPGNTGPTPNDGVSRGGRTVMGDDVNRELERALDRLELITREIGKRVVRIKEET